MKIILLFLVTLWSPFVCYAQEGSAVGSLNETGQEVSDTITGNGGADSTDAVHILEEMDGYLNLEEIQRTLEEFSQTETFSFVDTVKLLVTGEIPFDLQEIGKHVWNLFLGELKQQKEMAVKIFLVVLASAVFNSFVKVFENSQIADISYYMICLLISAMLVDTFAGLSGIVEGACGDLIGFMKVLMPAYLVTVVLSSGSVSAVGFYEITLLGMNLLQVFMIRILLPAISFYLVILILNQIAGEDYFSRLAGLVEMLISWTIKSILGIVLGLQAVQCIVAPAVDAMKSSALHRLVKTIPGIGTVMDSAAETVVGSAVVIKNAVGIAGMLALTLICLTPLIKLTASVLLFRFLCVVIQPFCEKRMVEGIDGISRSTVLLLKVQLTGLSVFLVSLAMITASVRGG